MHTTLMAKLYTARVAEMHEQALHQRRGAAARALRRRSRAGAQPETPQTGVVTIRWAVPGDDDAELTRLATLDSSPSLSGPLLLAEVDGQLRAALAPLTRQRVADPFYPTADVLLLLRIRARQLPKQGRVHTSVTSLGSAAPTSHRAL